jgi:hypothetical protein
VSGVDLVTFLRARLDEREAAAKAVEVPEDWTSPRWFEDVDAEFIALNDPQFVLADVAAKRRIVDEFGDAGEWLPANRDDDEPEYAYGRARTLHDMIKLLAAPFAQHPDFDPAWAL